MKTKYFLCITESSYPPLPHADNDNDQYNIIDNNEVIITKELYDEKMIIRAPNLNLMPMSTYSYI